MKHEDHTWPWPFVQALLHRRHCGSTWKVDETVMVRNRHKRNPQEINRGSNTNTKDDTEYNTTLTNAKKTAISQQMTTRLSFITQRNTHIRNKKNRQLPSRNFKTLASFCGCAGWFVSGLVGNSRRHILSCRGSYVLLCTNGPNKHKKTDAKHQIRRCFLL